MPDAIPLTIPVAEDTVATDVLPLVHTPPVVVLARVVAEAAHTLIVPVIAATVGSGLTVTTAVTAVMQPAPLVTV